MGGQLGGGGGYAADDGMAAWLEMRERRIRVLEAENQELRRQLDALRQGVGITVLIDGHPLTVAAHAPTATAGPTAAPVIHSDTRPAAAPRPPVGSRAAVQRPHVSQPGVNPLTPRATTSSPHTSGYAFEQPWRSPAPPAPQLPTPQPGPSLPSMPTTQVPIPAAVPPARRARAGAPDSSWLTDERPAVPSSATGLSPSPAASTSLHSGEDAWLRSGATWPHSPQHPAPSPTPPATPVPSAHQPARPVPTSRPAPRYQVPAERNIFADSFIL